MGLKNKFKIKNKQSEELTEEEKEEFRSSSSRNVLDGGKAKVLDVPKLNNGKSIPFEQIEEIVKTTDSMQIISKAFKTIEETDSQKLSEASRAILKSYDLAIRKIKATYQDIIETKKSISTEFLTVQVLIALYEEFSDVRQISKVINVFMDEIEVLLSHGKGIWFSDNLVIEAADYINKMIPIARMVFPDSIMVNMLKWDEVANILVNQEKITHLEKNIIAILAEAVNTNIKNGYYLKMGNLLVSRIRPTDSECMVLFDGPTIHRMNIIYSNERTKRRKGVINKSNYLNRFMTNSKDKKDEQLFDDVEQQINKQKAAEAEKYEEIRSREYSLKDGDVPQKIPSNEVEKEMEKDEEGLIEMLEHIYGLIKSGKTKSDIITPEMSIEIMDLLEKSKKDFQGSKEELRANINRLKTDLNIKTIDMKTKGKDSKAKDKISNIVSKLKEKTFKKDKLAKQEETKEEKILKEKVETLEEPKETPKEEKITKEKEAPKEEVKEEKTKKIKKDEKIEIKKPIKKEIAKKKK